MNILGAVSKVARDIQTRLLAQLHLHNALIPACTSLAHKSIPHPASSRSDVLLPTFDDPSNTDRRLKAAPPYRRIKLLALLLRLARRLEPARILHRDLIACFGARAVALLDDGFADAHGWCRATELLDAGGRNVA
jgi:hypothetical protein